jgi:hypothetical protein
VEGSHGVALDLQGVLSHIDVVVTVIGIGHVKRRLAAQRTARGVLTACFLLVRAQRGCVRAYESPHLRGPGVALEREGRAFLGMMLVYGIYIRCPPCCTQAVSVLVLCGCDRCVFAPTAWPRSHSPPARGELNLPSPSTTHPAARPPVCLPRVYDGVPSVLLG